MPPTAMSKADLMIQMLAGADNYDLAELDAKIIEENHYLTALQELRNIIATRLGERLEADPLAEIAV